MDVSPNALRKETAQTLKSIESLMNPALDVRERAMLLLAKAQCLQTLTLLNEQR